MHPYNTHVCVIILATGFNFLSRTLVDCFSIIEFAESDDSIGKMSLLWREKCGELCRECNDQSTEMDFICYLCGKVCLLLFVKIICTVQPWFRGCL